LERGFRLAEKVLHFSDGVELETRICETDKEVVTAIGTPEATTILRLTLPTRQQWMKVLAINLNLP
jgi:hypothetical protein